MKTNAHPLFAPQNRGARRIPADADVITRLQASFALLGERDPDWPAIFYRRLFERAPAVRSMFPDDMREQRKKLLAGIAVVVANLRDPAGVHARLIKLGRAHTAYGAQPEHYPVVIEVMVRAMAETGGEEWSEDLSAEWTGALRMVAAIMLEGAADPSRLPVSEAR